MRLLMFCNVFLIIVVAALQHWCNAQPFPDAPSNLTVEFREDTREGFLQHAVLDFSWTPPTNDDILTEYELVIEHVPLTNDSNRHNCSTPQDPVIVTVNQDLTAYSIVSENGSFNPLPIYTCNYTVKLVSMPGDMASEVLIFTIEYSSEFQEPVPVQTLVISCDSSYDPATVTHNVTLTVDLSNQHPLAKDVFLAHSLFAYAERLTITTIIERHETRPLPQGDVTEFTVHTLRPTLDTIAAVVEVYPYYPTTNDEEFYWRSDILPPGPVTCNTGIRPFPPTIVPLQNISNIDINNNTDEVSFLMEWTPPEFPNGELDIYQVCIRFTDVVLDGMEDCESVIEISIQNLTDPDQPSLMYGPVSILGPQLIIQIRSSNEFRLTGSWSDPAIISTEITPPPTSGTPPNDVPAWVYAIIGVVVAVIMVIILVIVAVCIFRRYCFHRYGTYKHDGAVLHIHGNGQRIHLSGFTLVADEWELRRDEIDVMTKKPLGQGAFGAVYRGILQPQVMKKLSRRKRAHERDRRFTMNCLVAVKMLKVDNLVASEKANFLKEIEMMKQVSSGENALKQFVVNMMGCITMSEPMLLVLEFVSHGDLQSYLRAIRKKFSNMNVGQNEPVDYLEPNGTYSQLKPEEEEYDKLGVLTERNLVDFARQIAAGMEYLSGLGIIHRDLACRNVLIGDDKILKVSDFGMSRLLPPDEVYVPTSHGPLPLRWMAIEALFYRHFSTKTDVWSYGVVLWEICTMGGFPYPTMGNRHLPEMLRSGYRMDKPVTCSQEVYEVMLDCWNLEAEERPNFPELHAIFDKFLAQQTQDSYPYMEVLSKTHQIDTTATDEILQDPDPTPINLDIEITDVDADTPMETPQRRLTRSISHNQPKKTLGITPSGSNFSLRSLNRSTHDSIQDIQAELARQADWIHTDSGREDALVDTRYVDSPTSFVNSRSASRNQ